MRPLVSLYPEPQNGDVTRFGEKAKENEQLKRAIEPSSNPADHFRVNFTECLFLKSCGPGATEEALTRATSAVSLMSGVPRESFLAPLTSRYGHKRSSSAECRSLNNRMRRSPQQKLSIVSSALEPFLTKKRIGDRVEVGGPVSQLGAAIQAISGHKLSVVSIQDMPHGSRLGNGTFIGVMGMFQRTEIDLLLSPSILNEERFILVEGATYDISTYRLLTWLPSKVVDPFNFAFSFTPEVWLAVLLSFLLFSLICWSIGKYLTPWQKSEPISLAECAWDLFSRFFPQDGPLHQPDWLRLCSIGHLFAFSLIFMIFLSSALTSSMTIRENEDFVNSYADVLRFPRVRIYSEKGTVLTQIFTDPHNDLFRKLNGRVIPVQGLFKLSPQVMKMVAEVEAKERVIVGSPEMCRWFALSRKENTKKCPKVTVSSQSSDLMMVSILISRSLPRPVRELIHKAILVTFENNIYRQGVRRTVKGYEACQSELLEGASDSTKPLSLLDVQGCFVLLSIGICAASISLLLELVKKRYCCRAGNFRACEPPPTQRRSTRGPYDSLLSIRPREYEWKHRLRPSEMLILSTPHLHLLSSNDRITDRHQPHTPVERKTGSHSIRGT